MGSAGVSTFSGTADVHLLDSVKLEIGDASDLTLFHDGSASYIRQDGTGYLYIDGNDSDTATQIILRPDRTETALVAKPNAEVELYYNNSQKFETTNDGVVITGICTDSLGNVRDIPLRSVTGSAATLVVTDAGKVVSTNTTGWTVPASTLDEGDTVTLLNNSAGGLVITCSAVTTYLTSDGTTVTSKTLGARGMATLYFVSSSVAYLQGTALS